MQRPVNPLGVASFEISAADLAKGEYALRDIKDGLPRAMGAAANKTLGKAKTVMVRGLLAYLTIRRQNLLNRVYVRKASSKTGQGGRLALMGRPMGLPNFNMRDTRKRGYMGEPKGSGVVGEIIRGQVEAYEGDFIAKGEYGNVHAFHRTTRRRFPIEADYSRSLYGLFVKSPAKQQVEDLVSDDLPKQFGSQLDRLLHIKR